MTKEIAINRIKEIERCTPIHTEDDVKDCKALEMAIQALSQEPCTDTVSREEERYNKGLYDGYTMATKQANAVIEDIKAEIEGLMSHDDYMVDGFNVLDIIDKYIGVK